MTGLAGVAMADRQRPVPRDLAARIAESIRHRGAGEVAEWSEPGIWLGHADGRNAACARSNLKQRAAGLRLIGDIRLDNRVDLGRALGLRDVSATSDVDLLLLGYAKWGTGCCRRLIGDFAFAIWDSSAGTLFCARDQLGVRPFYFSRLPDRFAFASDLEGLLDDQPLDEGRFVQFILGFADDPGGTAFQNISRLPAGHWLRFAEGQLAVERYWVPELEPRTAPLDAEMLFRETFIEAVEARTKDTGDLGAMLSGGLDSSSIVSIAASASPSDEPLRTYSFSYPATPRLDERCFVDAVTGAYKVRPTFVNFDDFAPLRGLEGYADGKSDLFFAPGVPKMSALFAAAHDDGSRVLLDGHGGDEVVSHGYGRLRELAKAGRWLELHAALRGVGGLFGESPNRLFARYFLAFGPLRRFARLAGRLGPGHQTATDEWSDRFSFLNPDFAHRSEAVDRYRASAERQRVAGQREDTLHLWTVASPGVAEGFEALDRAASHAGVELRFPFYDLRLVNLMLAVPAAQKLHDGWTRSILRRGMEGILPAKVQWRRDKIDFSSEISLGLAKHHRSVLADVVADRGGVGAYMDLGRLARSIAKLEADPIKTPGVDLFMIWRSIFLMQWLRNRTS